MTVHSMEVYIGSFLWECISRVVSPPKEIRFAIKSYGSPPSKTLLGCVSNFFTLKSTADKISMHISLESFPPNNIMQIYFYICTYVWTMYEFHSHFMVILYISGLFCVFLVRNLCVNVVSYKMSLKMLQYPTMIQIWI